MNAKWVLLLVVTLCTAWSSYSRKVSPLNRNGAFKNQFVCAICEEFTSKALDYLAKNSTQTEIIHLLRHTCTHVPSLEKQCTTVVDNYARLFFLEVTSSGPEDYCQKATLCQLIALVDARVRQERCDLCHLSVSEVLDKLKDPDTQMDIIEMLLKVCNSVEKKNVRKCKKMVLEYGPLVLDNAEQFLESRDVCAAIHACSKVAPVSYEIVS